MSVLDSVAASIASKAALAAREYDDLVSSLASDPDSQDPEIVESILENAGKTITDLYADIGTERRRNDLRQQMAMARELRGERPGLDAAIAEADAAFEAAKQLHTATVRPLRYRIGEIADAATAATAAKRQLRELAPLVMQEQLAALSGQLRRVNEIDTESRRRVTTLKAMLTTARADQISQLRSQIETAELHAAEIGNKSSELLRRQNELIAAMES